MGDHYAEMESISSVDRSLEERLKEYPELKAKIEAMLAIIENAGGDVEKAAEAEQRIIEEMRQVGHEALHSWARRQQQKKEDEYQAQPGVNRKRKKNSTGIRGWAESK
jgi:hypothetical protein